LMDQPHQPMYLSLLNKPISPGMGNLQAWVEEAWDSGIFSVLVYPHNYCSYSLARFELGRRRSCASSLT
ncbi:MAG: hypothetical protein NXY57DRAFT_907331, partial [Lentinula lateritia]